MCINGKLTMLALGSKYLALPQSQNQRGQVTCLGSQVKFGEELVPEVNQSSYTPTLPPSQRAPFF